MSEFNWTDAQRNAIESRGNTLVSAAAGSGKTATLSAKILHLLENEDTNLKEFLIVTFTKAAAAEMKERIGREIASASATDKRMSHHMRDVATADICTIHSFCTKIIRANFTSLGLTPDFAVADEGVAEVLKCRAMEDTVDDFFRGEEKITSKGACDIFTLADTVGKTKDAAGLDAELRVLYDKLISLGADENYLVSCADRLDEFSETDFALSPWGEVIIKETSDAAEYYLGVLNDVRREMMKSEVVIEKYMPAADVLCDYLERIIRAASKKSYADVKREISVCENVKLGTLTAKNQTEASESFKKKRDVVKKLFAKLANKYFSAEEDEIKTAMKRTASVLRGAADVLSVYSKRYSALKRERNSLDFADLETYALKLLEKEDGTPTPEALEIGRRYRFVFIDEYQDTNSVQDRIFRAVSTDAEKFFVGDIKQSIYSFRGAEPEVFSGYRRAWPEDRRAAETEGYPEGQSIFMSENFRCAEPVINFVNAVSRYMFPYGGIPFTESDCLVYGGVSKCDVPVEVCLLDGSRRKSEDEEALSEADYVADRIRDIIKSGEYRPCDIAILLRSANASGGEFERSLKERGIPVNRSGGTPFAEEPEVVLTLNILRAVDNPMRDIPLMGAMLSSVFGFTLDEIVRVRREKLNCPLYSAIQSYAEGDGELNFKCAEFVRKLDGLRNTERGMPSDRFIEYMYTECELYDAVEVASKVNGKDNLRRIHDFAKGFESGVFGGLYGFLKFIDEKLATGELTSEESDASLGVTIVSIHKSKGLEYPVCFLSQCGKERNAMDERRSLLFDRELGLAMRLPDPGGLIMCGNPIRDAVVVKHTKDSVMEEMRILYVAMTRARERLIVTAKCKGTPSSELEKAADEIMYKGEYTVLHTDRMVEHILSAIAENPNLSCVVTAVMKEAETSEICETPLIIKGESHAEETPIDISAIAENLAFRYSHSHMTALPSKLSVSGLYPEILDGSLEEGERSAVLEDFEEQGEAEAADMDEQSEEMPLPRFISGSVDFDPAEKGTSTHVFLQFADFNALRENGVRSEIDRLCEKGFITSKMASMVSVAQVEKFAHSGIVNRVLSAQTAVREFRFNLLLPASDFTTESELKEKYDSDDAEITVQGVFDCVFEDAHGKLVLLDYKTDAMSAYELRNPEAGREKLRRRHTRQLYYYARAVERIFGRLPDEIYVYSLPLGEAVPISVN